MNVRNLSALVVIYIFAAAAPLLAHCEVPCGIYTDDARFVALEEDLKTIEKAMGQIHELVGKTDVQSANQLARWVATKEDHAKKIQYVVTQYFMTQRLQVPPDEEGMEIYTTKLVLLHKILRGAMKCKQTVDTAQVAQVRELLHEFEHAYGK